MVVRRVSPVKGERETKERWKSVKLLQNKGVGKGTKDSSLLLPACEHIDIYMFGCVCINYI